MALQKIMRMYYQERKMNKFKILLILIMTLGLAGCANMSQTEQRTVTGGAGGAAVGAVIGALAGNAAMGAAIGAAAGTAGGYLVGKHKEAEQNAYEQGRRDGYNQQYR
jgi:uncharacterized membrane protein